MAATGCRITPELATHSELGLAIEVRSVSARRLVWSRYSICYRVATSKKGSVVRVLRVWHSHRDPATLELK